MTWARRGTENRKRAGDDDVSHVSTFKSYLENEFGMVIPKDVILQEQEGVIRVFSKTLMRMKHAGYMGFVAGKVSTKGIEVKSEFAQMFGKKADKNITNLDENQARDFVEADFVRIPETGEGYKIAKFGRHVLGVGKLGEGKLCADFIGKGRKRVENEIRK